MHHNALCSSAPCKIILSGEHAAVYGLSAIASAVALRTRCCIKRHNAHDPKQLIVHISNDTYSFDVNTLLSRLPSVQTLSDSSFQSSILLFEDIIPQNAKDVRPLLIILLLLTHISASISSETDPSLFSISLTITSEIPQGIGLGSSAALCTSLSALFLCWFGKFGLFPNEQDLESVAKWARLGEIIFHGTPSGIDTATCTYGKFVAVEKHQPRLITLPTLEVIIVDSKRVRPAGGTAAAVAMVERRVKEDKQVIHALDKMHGIANTIISSSPHGLPLPDLADLLEANHELLNEIGVGFDEAESIRAICKNYDVVCKITGSGMGGCLVGVPKHFMQNLLPVVDALNTAGFPTYTTTLGCQGVLLEVIEEE
ncbi:hypothetical protein RCL1_002668 [Eukaryota sp. TZLM3-RCL]